MAGNIHAPSKPLDLQAKWPELFEGMTVQQVCDVEQTVAASWHEGREPDREHTALLIARVLCAAHVAESAHSGEMEGFSVTPETHANADSYINGAIAADELVARTRERYGLS